MEIVLININFPYKRVNSILFLKLCLCLLFLKNNKLKVIYVKEAYFGEAYSASLQLHQGVSA